MKTQHSVLGERDLTTEVSIHFAGPRSKELLRTVVKALEGHGAFIDMTEESGAFHAYRETGQVAATLSAESVDSILAAR